MMTSPQGQANQLRLHSNNYWRMAAMTLEQGTDISSFIIFCLNRWLLTNPCADNNDIIAMKNKLFHSHTHTHTQN